jgi:Fe-S-cluster containining protein
MSATRQGKPTKRLPIVQARQPSPTKIGCLECALCCTYVAVEISAPDSVQTATEVLWYLYHEHMSVYRDSDDEWMLQFETRCRNLQDDNKCAIYETRPPICRTYSAVTCEVNSSDEGTTFYDAEAFLAYLKTRSSRVYRAIAKRYLPPANMLALQQPLGTKPLPPFGQRFAALRAKRLTPIAR